MLSAHNQATFVQWFSAWKILALQAVLLAGAILPVTPSFYEGGRWMAALDHPPLNIIKYAASCGLGLLAIGLLLPLWRAIRGLPAVEVSNGIVTAYKASGRSVALSKISQVGSPHVGNVTVEVAGERPLTLPVFLYKDSSQSWQRLKAILSKAPDDGKDVAQ